ncbi:hypothetical protein ACFX14_003080 [Malus domestica]
MASKSLSNSSFITVPLNLLNLRSKNLSFGSWRNTRGNFSAKRLLLKSRLNSSLRRLNLWGTVPQNLLESMWNYARSVSNPSSSGKYLVMSPPRLGCLWTAFYCYCRDDSSWHSRTGRSDMSREPDVSVTSGLEKAMECPTVDEAFPAMNFLSSSTLEESPHPAHKYPCSHESHNHQQLTGCLRHPFQVQVDAKHAGSAVAAVDAAAAAVLLANVGFLRQESLASSHYCH